MTCLTENIVLSRTRAQDLNSVRKLNCWGSELSDVSLVRKMPFVEVLSLSVNSINTLFDFSFCKNLQELYIRKNNIHDLNEVCYLQDLPRLKFLWLADNPCSECDTYRLTVLRALPSLVKLDNITVQPQEVDLAKTQGRVLLHPSKVVQQVEPSPASMMCVSTASTVSNTTERTTSRGIILEDNCNTTNSAPPERVSSSITRQLSNSEICENSFNLKQRRNIKNEPMAEPEDPPIQKFSDASSHMSTLSSPVERDQQCSLSAQHVQTTFQQSTVVHQSQQQTQQYSAGSSHNVSHPNHAFYARVQTLVDHTSRRPKKPTEFKCEGRKSVTGSMQALNLTEDSPNDYQTAEPDTYYNVVDNSDARSSLDSETSYYGDQRSAPRSDKGSPTRVLPKGGRNRNSNILSAVLCLIKELDYASLEVVETAIHCQMEELEN